MEEERALTAFAALSQETRLRIMRLLIQTGPKAWQHATMSVSA